MTFNQFIGASPTVLTVEWVNAKVEQLKAASVDEDYLSISKVILGFSGFMLLMAEDELHHVVMRAIAAGKCDDPAGCAAAALATTGLPFSRWRTRPDGDDIDWIGAASV